jgi:hypothetical protein
MARFRQVDGGKAGPSALGVLVPPGHRTLVVLRPRALAWDLVLLCRGTDGQPLAGFQELNREVAEAVAQRLARALLAGAKVRVEAVAATPLTGHAARVELDGLFLVVCLRLPGQAYRPLALAGADEAEAVVAQVRQALEPPGEAELYFNTHNFSRKASPQTGH